MSWSFNFDDFDELVPDENPRLHGAQATEDLSKQLGTSHHSSSLGTVTIADLLPGVSCAKMIGIIIAKQEPRHFPSRKDPTVEHYLLSFTMRDSPADFVNVTCWGGEEYITDMAQQFHITDIVEVSHVSVQNKPLNGIEERYHPWTPSPYCLNLSEKKSTIKVVTDWYLTEMSNLLHIPTKPENDYYTIGDVTANGQNLSGEFINVLAVVKQIGAPKEVTTKLGKKITRCDVKLFDDTCTYLDLILWDKELIHFAESWTAREHVLFAADVRVSYNDFRKCMIITATSKTIITVNPDSREAHRLYQYAKAANICDDEPMSTSFHDDSACDLNSIHEMYTVERIKNKQISDAESNVALFGVIFAYITTMDIDSDSVNIIAVRCAKCRFKVNSSTGTCNNLNCPQGCLRDLDAQSTDTHVSYDLRVAISDHTGTLSGCRVNPEVVNNMLQCSPNEYEQLSEAHKTTLKWKFLLERCKIIFKMLPVTFEKPQPLLKIISCERADPAEATRSFKNTQP